MNALLSLNDVSVRFGGITALNHVSFEVPRGSVCGLIGPNGAGKTTLFNCLSRIYRTSEGSIHFDGVDISTVPLHGMARLGIGRTFQNVALYRRMTVRENISVGGHCGGSVGFLATAFALPFVRREEEQLQDRVDEILTLLEIEAQQNRLVKDLPFGTQKRVELARALMTRPKLLLLDEPAAGLNHEEVQELKNFIAEIIDRFGVTVVLVEHHMELVMEISDYVVVLDFGKKIAEGAPMEIQKHPDVIRAYLGSA